MKSAKIISPESLLALSMQERRIIAYAAAKKNRTGYFPLKHKGDSKRLKAFHALLERGYIQIIKSDAEKIVFLLNSAYSDQKWHKFKSSTGEYVRDNNRKPIMKLNSTLLPPKPEQKWITIEAA